MKWILEVEVSDKWVAVGFNLTAERAHEMFCNELIYAYNDEITVKILTAPANDDILKCQGYHPESMTESEKQTVLAA